MDKLRTVIKQLDSKLHLLVVLVKIDQGGILNHLWTSIVHLGQAYDVLNARTRGVEQDLGDLSDVLDEFNLLDLSKGVMRALTQAIPQAGSNPQFSDLEDKVRELAALIATVDEDHQKAGGYLLGKLCGNPLPPQIHSGRGMLSLGTPIVDNTGIKVRNLGQLLQGFENLTHENTLLGKRVDLLSTELTLQGGGVLDGLGFGSEGQVREVVMKESPKGDAFEVFLDVMSLFCCDPAYVPVAGWEKFTRSMEDDYSPTACKVVSSYYQAHCAWYAEGKLVTLGKLLGAFKDAEKWNGGSRMDGRRHKIETSAAMSAEIAKTWVGDKLPSNGRLAPLALKMIERSVEWIHTIHKHLDLEYTKLTQQHIQEEEALILLSEELIIMFNQIHAVRCQRMEFVAIASQGNKAKYDPLHLDYLPGVCVS